MTFVEYMKQQTKRDDIVGDLARDMERENWLVEGEKANFGRWFAHIKFVGCKGAMEALLQAYDEIIALDKE